MRRDCVWGRFFILLEVGGYSACQVSGKERTVPFIQTKEPSPVFVGDGVPDVPPVLMLVV